MHALDAEALLDLCDRIQDARGTDRALAVLAQFDDGTFDHWEKRPLGHRDRRLLSVYRAVYGDDIQGIAHCASCRAAMEVTMRADTLDALMTGRRAGSAVWLEYASGNFTCQYRCPDSTDQRAVEATSDTCEARRLLIARCVRVPRHHGAPIAISDIRADDLSAIGEAIDKVDPGAVVTLTVTCAACRAENSVVFDSAEFLRRALQSDGRALLYEIHALAQAYGWRQGDVFALPARRRKAYVAMVLS